MLTVHTVSQVKHEEVTGPEAEEAIAQITQQPPSTPQEGSNSDPHASKPTTSALAEHDAAFPAIGAINGNAGPNKSPAAVNGGTSVVATIGDEAAYAAGTLDTALETAPSSVSVCLTVGDEGEDVLVALTLDGAQRYAVPCLSLPCPSLPCPSLPCPSLPCPSLPCLPHVGLLWRLHSSAYAMSFLAHISLLAIEIKQCLIFALQTVIAAYSVKVHRSRALYACCLLYSANFSLFVMQWLSQSARQHISSLNASRCQPFPGTAEDVLQRCLVA